MNRLFEATQCDRCKVSLKQVSHTLSFMNEDVICMNCRKEEKKHPLYNKAREEELIHLQNGINAETEEERKKYLNYPGLFAGKKWGEF